MNIRLSVMSGLLVAAFAWQSVWADDPKITLCDHCSTTSQFARSAENAALSEFPILNEGVQEVFVINRLTDKVRYFVVTREFIGDANGFGDGFWSTTTSSATPIPSDLAEIRDALGQIKEFAAQLSNVHIDELDLGPVEIDSVTDLLGPNVDGVIDFRRGTIQNALADLYASGSRRAQIEVTDLGGRVVEIVLPKSINETTLTLEFSDGTTVKFEISLSRDIDDGKIELKFDIDPDSARGPGLSQIPSTIGAFLDAFGNGFEGDPEFIDGLADLFVRVGGRVQRREDSGGGGCQATMECFQQMNDDTGEMEAVCRVSGTRDELTGC